MITYDKAFSTNLKSYMTAQQANELYTGKKWDGSQESALLFTNDEFQCSDNCNLKLTCANIHIDFSDYQNYKKKHHPYFSSNTGLSHSNNCHRILKRSEKRKSKKNQTQYYTQEGNKFILSFKKDIGFPQANKSSKSVETLNTGNKNLSKTNNSHGKTSLSENKRIPHISSINRMIDLFTEYLLNDNSIELFNANRLPITFDDVFTPIDNQQIDNSYTIYYGQAYVKWVTLKNNSKVLRLSFFNDVKLLEKDTVFSPHVFLFESDFKKNNEQSLYKKFVTSANQNAHKFLLYYVGTFNSSKDGLSFDYQKNNIPKSLFIRSSGSQLE